MDRADQKLTVRPCREADLGRILEIEQSSFPDPYDLPIFTQLLASEPSGFLVVERNGRVIGYIAASSRRRDATIFSIAVEEQSKRMGAGRLLMQAELDYLSKRVERVNLQVSVRNPAAISLYRRFSFVERGRIRGYYPNGDDAIIMTLDLRAARAIRRQ